MVKLTQRVVVYPFLTLLILGGVWMLIPTIVGDRYNPHVGVVRDAIVSYQAVHGRFPSSLVDTTSFLDLQMRSECVITSTGPDRYRVKLARESGRAICLDVTYAATEEGEWETYDAQVIDCDSVH